MGILANPPSYLTASQFKAMGSDYDYSRFDDPTLQNILNRASGKANSIMRRSLLAQEKTLRYEGNGSNRLDLEERPILYMKRLQIVVPGTTGISVPLDQLLIDYVDGQVFEYTPLLWQGAGFTAIFPKGVPIDILLGTGYSATTILKPPTWTSVDSGVGELPAGTYNAAIVPRTMVGELPTAVQQITTSSGSILFTVNPVLGAYLYRVYMSSATHNTTINMPAVAGATQIDVASIVGLTAGSSWLLDTGLGVAEVVTLAADASAGVAHLTSTLQYAHSSGATLIPVPLAVSETAFTSYGTTPIQTTVSSLTPVDGLYPDQISTVDTSMPPVPQEILEATRLLTLSMMWEQNNLANRGINAQKSGRKEITWRSTEGTAGKGTPLFVQEAAEMLKPWGLEAIY